MNLRQLRHFVTVAETLHFGRAAKQLHMSQPPLSQSIQQLEKAIGFTLFIRSNKSVSLTDAGTYFYQEAVALLRHTQTMQDISAQVAKGLLGRLRIGFVGAMMFRGLAQNIHLFNQGRQNIELILLEMNTAEQIDAIEREQIDVGFIHTSYFKAPKRITSKLLLTEPFVCCMPKNHPLSASIYINVSLLKDEPFLLFPRFLSPHYHDQIIAIFMNAGIRPEISHELRSWRTIVSFVAQGFGLALVPASMQKADTDFVTYRPLIDNDIQSETLCIWHTHRHPPLLEQFLSELFVNR